MLEWIKKFFGGGTTREVKEHPVFGALIETHEHGNPAEWKDNPNEQVKHMTGWVYAAVNRIAEGCSGQDIHFYIQKGKNEFEELPYEHELNVLFRRVNPLITYRQLVRATLVSLELTGNAYWALSLKDDKYPYEIWHLPSQYVKVIPSKGTFVGGYTFSRSGVQTRKYEPEEVIHFKYPSASHLFYGDGPLQAAAESVDADEAISTLQWKMFDKGLFPGSLIAKLERFLTPEQVIQLRKELEAAFQGPKKAGRVFIAHGGTDLEQLTKTPREMDFARSEVQFRDKILAIFGVPRTIVGIPEGANRAAAAVMEITFARWVLKPKLEMLAQIITERLCSRYAPNLICEFDSPVPKDSDVESLRRIRLVRAGIISPNEARKELGYDPVKDQPEADRLLIKVPEQPMQTALKQVGPASPLPPPELDPMVDFIFDREAESEALEGAIGKFVEESLKKGALLEAARLKVEVDVHAPIFVEELLNRKRARWDATVGKTTVQKLKKELAAGITAGETSTELITRVDRLFEETYRNRGTTIARTEVASAANAGALKVGIEAGMDRKRWVAALDEYTRTTHQEADGQEVGMGESFTVGGAQLRYPGDPAGPAKETANCRCVVTTVLGKSKSFYDDIDKAFRSDRWKLEGQAEEAAQTYIKGLHKRVRTRLEEYLREAGEGA